MKKNCNNNEPTIGAMYRVIKSRGVSMQSEIGPRDTKVTLYTRCKSNDVVQLIAIDQRQFDYVNNLGRKIIWFQMLNGMSLGWVCLYLDDPEQKVSNPWLFDCCFHEVTEDNCDEVVPSW